MSRVIHVSSNEELDKHLKDDRVTIEFSAEWSGTIMTPDFESLSSEYTTYTFLQVDIDQLSGNPLVSTITNVPFFQFYVKGVKMSEFEGTNKSLLKSNLEKYK
ncbi:hypothetical protein ACTFIY_005144 [Dictyostelium cf. discoideum]